ncbi:hypothetical protein [Desulfitobacterium sp.]|uniref:hypothetical protein n=1 Tax=Desulfitobacterium sp. TaxID=49981 RepID=UPI002B1F544B|nr:hypothetical protein [Desulfitobacterium sp.]MEA4900875.1 hypothetical protein [Desulfitobacterium sp.]
MKKISVFLLALMLLFSTLSPVSAATATPTTPETSSTLAQTDMVEPNLVEVKTISGETTLLKEVKTASGDTTLINAAATSYPTPWVPNSQWNLATSQLLRASTRNAFNTAMFTFLTGRCSNAATLASIAAGAFGTTYMNGIDQETEYYYHSYQWREYGPPTFDGNGNIIPKYEIQKTQRTSPNSDWTGGDVTVTTQYGSILTPWF